MVARSSALSATVWSASDVVLRQGFQFAISIVLARLLTPEDFGIIAMLLLFAGIAGAFANGGLTWALIQCQDVTIEDESTVFWLNLLAGSLVALLFWFSGVWIAAFYEVPVLENLAGLMAVTVVVTAIGGTQQALFSKALNFRPLLVAGASAALTSGVVSIWLAWQGYGVWALAVQALVSAMATTTVVWFASSWRPRFICSLASAKRLFGFGGYMLLSSLLDIVYLRFYAILIGKFYGVREVGFYTRAETTSLFPAGIVIGIVGRVTFPLFSHASGDLERLRTSLQLAMRSVALVYAPAMFGLLAVAEPLVLVLFGKQWLPAVPFLQVLCLTGLFLPLQILNHHALLALGRSELHFRLEVLKKVMGISILVSVAGFGAIAIAWGTVLASTLSYLVNTHYSRKLLAYGFVSQLRDMLPVLFLSFGMAAIVTVVDYNQVAWSAATRLFVGVVLGILIYGVGLLLLGPKWLVAVAGLFVPQRWKRNA
ncbi:lipopolysaccharide biosynthesis protein [Hoeflea sp.]|uniref:lipopolysaccharide biosynthesis protein n=1 Tax=Hoeflea sp. TaxID=1940281 RepID=UPI0025BFA43F|nr:lipopolysaccharide biosynthesis protein [Hoeflea sp.]